MVSVTECRQLKIVKTNKEGGVNEGALNIVTELKPKELNNGAKNEGYVYKVSAKL